MNSSRLYSLLLALVLGTMRRSHVFGLRFYIIVNVCRGEQNRSDTLSRHRLDTMG